MVHDLTSDPLLVVGCQRSGTTLLRTILNAHSRLTVGYECDFFQVLADTYGESRDIWQHMERFLDDLMAVNRFDFWNLPREEIRTVFEAAPKPILYPQAIRLICEAYRRKHKPEATLYGVKNPNSIEHLDAYFALFPQGQVIHIIRDPRAVLASEKKKFTKRDGQFNSFLHTIRVARRWNKALRAQSKHKTDARLYALRYHDLISDMENTLRPLCEWLGLPFDEKMLTYYESSDTPEKEMWQHSLTKAPPKRERLAAYLDELSETEVRCINYLCREHMSAYSDGQKPGYQLVSVLPALSFGWAQWVLMGIPRKTLHLLRKAFSKKVA